MGQLLRKCLNSIMGKKKAGEQNQPKSGKRKQSDSSAGGLGVQHMRLQESMSH